MTNLGAASFSLAGEGVALNSITLPAAADFGTSAVDLQATSINLAGNAVLTGGAVSLTGAITASNNLNITAMGVITINNNINLGTTGEISLTSSGSGGGINLGAVVLTGRNITLLGTVASANNDLTLTVGNILNLGSNIDRGTGNLTLTGAGQAVLLAVVRTLSGNVVTIGSTLGLVADGDLTISAGGNLMVNTNISLGSGATTTLRLEAGRGMGQTGDISFSSNTLELRASRFFLTQNGAVFGNVRPVAFQDADGTGLDAEATELITRIAYDGTETQAEVDWANILLDTVSRGPGGTADFEVAAADFVNGVLAAAVSITLDAGTGVLTFAATGDITLRAPTITITAGTIDLGADRTLTLTAETGTLTLNFTAATTITGTVTGMGTAGLSVIAEDIAFSGTPPILNVPTVSLELTGAGNSFDATAPFATGSMIGTLTITTQAVQEYRGWMAAMGRNLTITAPRIFIGATAINLGTTGNLSLDGVFGILLTNLAGLTITAGDVSVFAGSISNLNTDDGEIFNIPHLVVEATGNIMISDLDLRTARIELLADNGAITVQPRFRMNRGRPSIRASVLLMRQSVAFAEDLVRTTSSNVTGAVELRITTEADQTIHEWMLTLGGTSFSLRGVDGVTLASITLPAALTYTGDIDLQATAITLTAATTLTGGAISLTGAITASNNLTITAMGVLTLNSDITLTGAGLTLALSSAGAISNGGRVGAARPALTASTVSLAQDAAFATTGPFRFAAALNSLTLQTAAPQDVHDWMIAMDRALTVTSALNVFVRSAIDLGAGALSLTSTGGVIRILENISTTGGLTLNGSTGINFNNRAAKTLSGGTITLTGNAGSNRDLTLTATTGALTINGDINTGTSALSLSVPMSGGIALGGALMLTGGAITLTGAATGADSLTIIASSALTINSDIMLTGTASILVLRSRQGAITGMGTLSAPTVRLRQVAAFAEDALFTFGSATGSLVLVTDANQDVHDWMIEPGRNLIVSSSRRVRVLADIVASGSGARNLGAGSLTLTSTGGVVRILANITTTGGVTITAGGILTISSNINIGTNALTLTSGAGAIIAAAERPVLTASTVSLRQVDAFASRRPFRFGSGIDSLEFTTTVNQDVHNWMIVLDANLTVTSSNRVRVLAAIGSGVTGRNLGAGVLTLTSTGRVVRILADITTTGDVTITASGILTISSNINIGTNALTLTSGAGAIIAAAERPVLTASTVSLRQVDAFASRRPFRFGSGIGSLEFTTTVNQDVHNWMIVPDTNLTVTSSNRVRVAAAIGMDEPGRNLGGGVLTLTSTGRIVRIVADITTTGDVTITASSTLTISSDINIGANALTLTSGAGAIVGADRPILTASTVSFTQNAAFAAIRPFRFGAATGSLEFTTTVNQDVHNWMIVPDTNLTVTSSNRVRVLAAIGMDEPGRNLGAGVLTLTSTGRDVRILADISTTGDVTLDASGILTINNNINIGTTGTTLTLTGTSLTFGSIVALTAGAYSLSDGRTCNTGTSPSCTTIIP